MPEQFVDKVEALAQDLQSLKDGFWYLLRHASEGTKLNPIEQEKYEKLYARIASVDLAPRGTGLREALETAVKALEGTKILTQGPSFEAEANAMVDVLAAIRIGKAALAPSPFVNRWELCRHDILRKDCPECRASSPVKWICTAGHEWNVPKTVCPICRNSVEPAPSPAGEPLPLGEVLGVMTPSGPRFPDTGLMADAAKDAAPTPAKETT